MLHLQALDYQELIKMTHMEIGFPQPIGDSEGKQ